MWVRVLDVKVLSQTLYSTKCRCKRYEFLQWEESREPPVSHLPRFWESRSEPCEVLWNAVEGYKPETPSFASRTASVWVRERTSSFRIQDHVDGEVPSGNILKHLQTANKNDIIVRNCRSQRGATIQTIDFYPYHYGKCIALSNLGWMLAWRPCPWDRWSIFWQASWALSDAPRHGYLLCGSDHRAGFPGTLSGVNIACFCEGQGTKPGCLEWIFDDSNESLVSKDAHGISSQLSTAASFVKVSVLCSVASIVVGKPTCMRADLGFLTGCPASTCINTLISVLYPNGTLMYDL